MLTTATSAARHRAPGHGRYVARRRSPARHHRPGAPPPARTRAGLLSTIGGLAVANLVLAGLAVHQARSGDTAAAMPPPPPRITFPAPDRTAPRPARRAEAAQRQRAKPRPPVLLGPASLDAALTAYCADRVIGARGARPGSSTWVCDRVRARPFPIDMDVACRWRYGPDAWAGMLDDNDQ